MVEIFECHIIAKKKQAKKKKTANKKVKKYIYIFKQGTPSPLLHDTRFIGLLRYCHFKVLAILTSFSNDRGDINSHKFKRTPFKHHSDKI